MSSKQHISHISSCILPVQGGIDEAESIEAAASRELLEETGIKGAKIVKIVRFLPLISPCQ